MPTISLGPEDKEYAVSFAVPTDTEGLIMIIGLFMRWKASIAFGIGHGTIHRQVIVLTVDDKILKSPEIIGSALLINIIGCAVYSIHGIHANTALEAGSRFLPKTHNGLGRFMTMMNGTQYLESIQKKKMRIFCMNEELTTAVGHPIPSQPGSICPV